MPCSGCGRPKGLYAPPPRKATAEPVQPVSPRIVKAPQPKSTS